MVMPLRFLGSTPFAVSISWFAIVMAATTVSAVAAVPEQVHCKERRNKQYPYPVLSQPFHDLLLGQIGREGPRCRTGWTDLFSNDSDDTAWCRVIA